MVLFLCSALLFRISADVKFICYLPSQWADLCDNSPARRALRRAICGVGHAYRNQVVERNYLGGQLWRRRVGGELKIDRSPRHLYNIQAQVAQNELRLFRRRSGKQDVRRAVEHLKRLADVDGQFWMARSGDDDEPNRRREACQQHDDGQD